MNRIALRTSIIAGHAAFVQELTGLKGPNAPLYVTGADKVKDAFLAGLKAHDGGAAIDFDELIRKVPPLLQGFKMDAQPRAAALGMGMVIAGCFDPSVVIDKSVGKTVKTQIHDRGRRMKGRDWLQIIALPTVVAGIDRLLNRSKTAGTGDASIDLEKRQGPEEVATHPDGPGADD